jgi:hypothetical protein
VKGKYADERTREGKKLMTASEHQARFQALLDEHPIGRSPYVQQLMKDLAGNNLNAAQSFLATLRESERE